MGSNQSESATFKVVITQPITQSICLLGEQSIMHLIKSRPRGPVGPLTDFSCQNVFYMPTKDGQKRPTSAPVNSKSLRDMT